MTLQEPELVPDEFDDPMQHQTLALEYFGNAYEAYLEGGDAPFPNQLQILEDRYGMCSWPLKFYTLLFCSDEERKSAVPLR
jgi:hypothetical protein